MNESHKNIKQIILYQPHIIYVLQYLMNFFDFQCILNSSETLIRKIFLQINMSFVPFWGCRVKSGAHILWWRLGQTGDNSLAWFIMMNFYCNMEEPFDPCRDQSNAAKTMHIPRIFGCTRTFSIKRSLNCSFSESKFYFKSSQFFFCNCYLYPNYFWL